MVGRNLQYVGLYLSLSVICVLVVSTLSEQDKLLQRRHVTSQNNSSRRHKWGHLKARFPHKHAKSKGSILGRPSSTTPISYGNDQYVAMCLIAKDCSREDLLEWVEHYLKLGVRRIYLYDHGSQPPLIPIIAHYQFAGLVEYHWFTNDMMDERNRPYRQHGLGAASDATGHKLNAQLWVYQDCLSRYRRKHRWMAFFDADEFLMLTDPTIKDLPTFLKGYEAYGGLAVNWMSFGSSGHLTRPTGTTVESYWKCAPSRTVKVICNTVYCTGPDRTPHMFSYRDGKYVVSEDFERVEMSQKPTASFKKVVLNHYVTKSKEEFLAKAARGSGDGTYKTEDFLKIVDRTAWQNCTDAVKLMEGRTFNIADVL